MSNEPNGWNEYKKLVTYRLDELKKRSESIENKVDKISTKITVLETKSMAYGAFAGLLITIVANIVIALIKYT